MPPLHVVPFTSEFLPAAAQLFAARWQRDRQSEPAFSERWTDPSQALLAVQAAWGKDHTRGAAAFQGERLVGYLFADLLFDTHTGRQAWVRLAGHALAPDFAPELYGDLYAHAGKGWLEWGCFFHYLQYPAADRDGLWAWSGLGFAHQQVYGYLDVLHPPAPPAHVPEGVEVRRATPQDRLLMEEAGPLIAEHLTGAPTWAPTPPEIIIRRRKRYGETVDEDGMIIWLALVDGRFASLEVFYPEAESPEFPEVSPHLIEQGVGQTIAPYRGRGLTRLLVARALAELREQGYRWCLTDWRAANLEAARTWPRLGWEPAWYRLHRPVDSRIAWANYP